MILYIQKIFLNDHKKEKNIHSLCLFTISNLWKFVGFEISSSGLQLETVIKTNIKYPSGYKLFSTCILLSDGTVNLNNHPSYTKDKMDIIIGKSPDGYIQYSVFNVSASGNSHMARLIFRKI